MIRSAIGPATATAGALFVATVRAGNAAADPPEVIARVAAGFDPDAVRGMIGR